MQPIDLHAVLVAHEESIARRFTKQSGVSGPKRFMTLQKGEMDSIPAKRLTGP
jgi:hypothetical protein